MRLMKPDDEELVEYLENRRYLSNEQKSMLEHPLIFNKKDALAYWIQVYRQDAPVYLLIAGISLIGIPIYMIYRIIHFAVNSLL